MKARELAEILLQNPDKDVHFATGDGGCTGTLPVETVEILKVFFLSIIIICFKYKQMNCLRKTS